MHKSLEQRRQRPREKVVRYWPGRAAANEGDKSRSGSDSDSDSETRQQGLLPAANGVSEVQSVTTSVTTNAASFVNGTVYNYDANKISSASDRRLRRLQQHSEQVEEVGRHPRRAAAAKPQAPKPPEVPQSTSADDEEDSALVRRRQQLMKARLRAESEPVANDIDELEIEHETEESEESSESSGDDSEDSENSAPFPARPLLKPVFVPKALRETVAERERREKELEEAEVEKARQLEARKLESHNLVEEVLRKEIAEATVNDTIPDVDDTDGLDEDMEFEAWKLRELMRIKRDREERNAEEQEIAETERRRNMTDAELLAENEKIEGKNKSERKSMRFLQKYYHKGAFFADEEILQKRDFNEPTLEDKFDKSILPEVMQVKNFGMSGQTKWTHLSKEDTSSKDSAWFQNKCKAVDQLINYEFDMSAIRPIRPALPATSKWEDFIGGAPFVFGLPGLGAVCVKGVVRISHRNPTATKSVPFVAVRLKGVSRTKVRPQSALGLRGQKFKGRWNHHASLPPLVLYGGASSHPDPLLLRPKEIVELPFEFRIGKYEAMQDLPQSLILPAVDNLRSRGETRHWIECTINWYRKGGVILSERRVALEIWIDFITPPTLSGMLVNRTEEPEQQSTPSVASSATSQKISEAGSKASSFVGINNVEAAVAAVQAVSNSAKKPTSSPSLIGRTLSVAKPSIAGSIKWQDEGYIVTLNRRVFAGGESLQLNLRLAKPAIPESETNAFLDPPELDGKSSSNDTISTQSSNQRSKFSRMMSNVKSQIAEGPKFLRKTPNRKSTLIGEDAIRASPNDDTSNLSNQLRQCTVKVFIEETQTVRAPVDSENVASVNDLYAMSDDSFVRKSLMSGNPAPADLTPNAEPLSPTSAQLSPDAANFVRCATGKRKLVCLLHNETFTGTSEEERSFQIKVPPLFGVEHFDSLIAAESCEFDSPSMLDRQSTDEIDDQASLRSPIINSGASTPLSRASSFADFNRVTSPLQRPGRFPSPSPSSFNDSQSLRRSTSIIRASRIQQTDLSSTQLASSRVSQRASNTVVSRSNDDVDKLESNATSDGTRDVNIFAVYPSCDHAAISVSHEIVVVLEIKGYGGLGSLTTEHLSVPEDLHIARQRQERFSKDEKQSMLPKRGISVSKNMFAKHLLPRPKRSDSTSSSDSYYTPAVNDDDESIVDDVSLSRLEHRASVLSQTPSIAISRASEESNEREASASSSIQKSTAPSPRFHFPKLPPLANGLSRLTHRASKLHISTSASQSAPELYKSAINNESELIELRHAVTISALRVEQCRDVALERPSFTGDGLFGVPLGYVEVLKDESGVSEYGANSRNGSDIGGRMSRNGSIAGFSIRSTESRVSWTKMEAKAV
ncbi:Microfibrillar-associated protein 1 [Entophlyctis luteolus]|nr:Microfibrillar-associated protein 1 [Entophlyctis luteolus]